MAYQELILRNLTEKYFENNLFSVEKLPQSGSNRLYFRLIPKKGTSIIGVYNEDIRENEAFFYLTNIFRTQGINVPEILIIDKNRQYYLLQDLGDETLYSFLTHERKEEQLGKNTLSFYYKVLKELPRIQKASSKIDFSYCYPRHAFDRQSMQWDLNYFKYYFLKLAGIYFDEQLLENDFNTLINFLLEAKSDFFLYRDFQSRNIMLHESNVYFIDYQGGREGAIQYDVASLLYDGKADLSTNERKDLLDFYISEMEQILPITREEFLKYFDSFVLIRILQALGTYGFRGYYEKKSHFLLSIPYAIRNIRHLLEKSRFPDHIPELIRVLHAIANSTIFPKLSSQTSGLSVTITSFSYKKGIPQDLSANGGGFVFDCRALPNPGREEVYKTLSGKDNHVIRFLEKHKETIAFTKHVTALVEASVNNYLERKLTHLMVNFGCTGGQHRSVYFAETLAKQLKEKFPSIHVMVRHTNESSWPNPSL